MFPTTFYVSAVIQVILMTSNDRETKVTSIRINAEVLRKPRELGLNVSKITELLLKNT